MADHPVASAAESSVTHGTYADTYTTITSVPNPPSALDVVGTTVAKGAVSLFSQAFDIDPALAPGITLLQHQINSQLDAQLANSGYHDLATTTTTTRYSGQDYYSYTPTTGSNPMDEYNS